jgi:hypothetical protein
MVRTVEDKIDLEHVDFSIIPSLRCNLRCPFCMYDCSPDNNTELNYVKTEEFISTIDWGKISSWGFYGGEPSIDTPNYDRFMNLIPKDISKFIITNGSWSSSAHAHLDWWEFVNKRVSEHGDKLRIVISGTPEHKRFQRGSLIESIGKWEGITLKEDDDIHPMGRAKRDNWTCSKKCLTHPQPIRLGIFPTGDIILQNCDGVYPVISNYESSFEVAYALAKDIRLGIRNCHNNKNINDVIENLGGLKC